MKLSSIIVLMMVLMAAVAAYGQSSDYINYQGRLTDPTGNPVPDNNYQLTFTLYDDTGGPLWTSGMQTVGVADGLFYYLLGSAVPIPASVFGATALYLGIKVGEDPEISPRTLLTSSPYAVVAGRVNSEDMESGEGYLHLKNINGDSIVTFNTEVTGGRMQMITPVFGGKGQMPILELLADNTGGGLSLFDPDIANMGERQLTITSSDSEGPRIDLFFPGGGAEAGIVQIAANPDVGGFISIHAAEPLLAEGGRIGVAAPDTGFIRLFGGGHGSEYPLVEITAQSEEGGKLNIYNEIGKVMGFEPSPFNTQRLQFYDPSSSLPNDPFIRMGIEPSPFIGARLEMFDPGSGWVDFPMIRMGTEPSPFHSAGIEMLNPEMTDEASLFEMNIVETGIPGEWKSVLMMNTGMSSKANNTIFELSAGISSGSSIKMFQPQPEPPGHELIGISAPTSGGSIKMFQPQPEPPGKVAIEMGMNSTAKGSGGGRLAVYDADSISTELTGGILQIYHPTDVTLPGFSSQVDSELVTMNLTGKKDVTGGGGAKISMVAREDSAKVGIGTDDPAEALHVVGNITCTGEMYIFTTTKLKTNIRPINNAVQKINNLNGVHYNYKYDEYPKLQLPETDQVGLLAEDVEKVLPELVHEDKDGNKLVAYIKLTAVLIEAIKEQQETINELRERIEKIEGQ